MRLVAVRVIAFLLPVVCLAQGPTIGVIQIYGNHRVPEVEIRKVLEVHEGGTLPKSKGDIEDRLAEMENIVSATLFAACCDDRKTILYVGVEEKGGPHFDFNSEPASNEVSLPPELARAYAAFLNAASEAARTGEIGEDLSQGHSLMANAKVRYIQLGFVVLADEHGPILRKVLHECADAEQRAIAAYILGYARDKSSVQDDLQYALRDPDDTVRANALRALGAFAVYAAKRPDSNLKVSPTWLIEMLNSLVWTDRNNAAVALVTLTEKRDPSAIGQLRSRALPSLIEMARWKHLPHALPAFILVGRIADVPEDQLQEAWNKELREPILKRALSSGKK
ncbi:MAG: HEAT repeat domain-containing protein [Bryobacteraceae bacterium]|nr:HEAT repeat domain-containing protein [Bryobacteraceae bacterium]